MDGLDHDEITRLSPEERLAPIAALWDSLDEGDVTLTPAQVLELERRLDSLEADRAKAVTWEQLRDELRRGTS